MATILEYKVRIKEWEKNFASKHGKPPSKSDVKADPDIRKAYKVYNELKKAATDTFNTSGKETAKETEETIREKEVSKQKSSSDSKSKSLHSSKSRRSVSAASHQNSKLPSVDVFLTDDEEMERNVIVRNAELGPTPQANGKVMSLFDSLMSPPDSSPIRRGPIVKNELLSVGESPSKQNIFKTPTNSVRRIEASNVTPSRSSGSLMERLRTAASPSVGSTSNNPTNEIMETPFYLGKVASKFSFSDALNTSQESPSKNRLVGSPSKARLAWSPSKANLVKTPEKPTSLLEEFQVSPSPLKSQRYLSFGGTKKVSQIFQEFQSLATTQDFEEQKRELEEETEQIEKVLQQEAAASQLQEAPSLARKRKKALTQKRTTRRWKIKPRLMEDSEETTFEGKDVHEEINRLEKANQAELQTYLNGDASGHESTDEEEASDDDDDADHEAKPILRNPNLSTKINPISNNYQRLKINDPRAKKFKQRMKRR